MTHMTWPKSYPGHACEALYQPCMIHLWGLILRYHAHISRQKDAVDGQPWHKALSLYVHSFSWCVAAPLLVSTNMYYNMYNAIVIDYVTKVIHRYNSYHLGYHSQNCLLPKMDDYTVMFQYNKSHWHGHGACSTTGKANGGQPWHMQQGLCWLLTRDWKISGK